MRSVMRLQHKGTGTHPRQPVFGELHCLQEAACPLDARQPCGHAVGNAERGLKATGNAHDTTTISFGTRTRPVRRSDMRADFRAASLARSASSSPIRLLN